MIRLSPGTTAREEVSKLNISLQLKFQLYLTNCGPNKVLKLPWGSTMKYVKSLRPRSPQEYMNLRILCIDLVGLWSLRKEENCE
jgi:hypothetical protein